MSFNKVLGENEKCVFFFFFNKFIYLFLAVSGLRCCARAFSSCGQQGLLFVRCAGVSLRQLLLFWSTGSRRAGFNSCGTRAQQLYLTGSRVQAQQLWHTGLVAPRHVGSSQTRARTCVSCVGRRILNHCATREVPEKCVFYFYLKTKGTLWSTQYFAFCHQHGWFCASLYLLKPYILHLRLQIFSASVSLGLYKKAYVLR